MADEARSDAVDSWWSRVSPLLDDVLELAVDQRAAWLADLQQRDAPLAHHVELALSRHEKLHRQRFLDQPPAVSASTLRAGAQVGAYRLIEPLGQGGMGVVWFAERADGRFEGKVAIKVLNTARLARPADELFVREATVLAQLQHPNIAHLIDAGITDDAQPFLVLEYVNGARIDRYCEAQKLSIEARVQLFLQVLAAVAHAHSRLVVHCDLKPANVLIAEGGQVKLLDFGIATLLRASATETPDDADGNSRGMTPTYAAPEQLRAASITTATDVYSLGLVLFTILTGRHPASDRTVTSITGLMSARQELLSRPSNPVLDTTGGGQLNADLDSILSKALQDDPTGRYQSVGDFADDLQRYLTNRPISVRERSFRYRTQKFLQRNRAAVLSGALVAVALLVTTSFALVQMFDARRQRDEADLQTRRAEGFSNLITSLISQGGPAGHPLTAEELLDRATVQVQNTYKDDPEALVSMLLRIAGRYYDLGLSNKEYAVEVAAETAARHANDAALLLDVQCNTVETEINLGRTDAAAQRMEKAMRLLATLNDVDPKLRADCFRNSAQLAWLSGDRERARADVDQGISLLRDGGDLADNRYSGLLSIRAAYANSLVEAHRTLLEREQLDERYARSDAVAGYMSKVLVASSLLRMGRVAEARQHLEQAAPELKADPIAFPPVESTLLTYCQILRRLNETQRLKPALNRLIANLQERDDTDFLVRAKVLAGVLLLQENDLSAADLQLKETNELVRTIGGEAALYPTAWQTLAQLTVLLQLQQGNLDAATIQLDAALAHARSMDVGDNPYIAPFLLLKARLELAKQNYPQADRDAREAVRLFSLHTLNPAESADVGEAKLVLAQSLHARHELAAAMQAAKEAQTALAISLGKTHPLVLEAAAVAQQERSK